MLGRLSLLSGLRPAASSVVAAPAISASLAAERTMAMLPRQRGDKDEYSKVIAVHRTAKVRTGGRTFAFNAVVVVGNRRGVAGFGFGHGLEVSRAVQKAMEDARRNQVYVDTMDMSTIPHEAEAKFCQTIVTMRPAKTGSGIRASHVIKAVCEAFGIEDVSAKIHGRTAEINVVRAAFKALEQIEPAYDVARRRGLLLVDPLSSTPSSTLHSFNARV